MHVVNLFAQQPNRRMHFHFCTSNMWQVVLELFLFAITLVCVWVQLLISCLLEAFSKVQACVVFNCLVCAGGMLQPAVKDKVQKLLGDNSMGDLAKWKAVSKCLIDDKIMYKMKLKADQLLVHPQDRGGMGLQVFSMHAKGQRIIQCGCDLSLLGGSTCIELNPDPAKRKAQCQMMHALHEAHPDYVAPVSGHERYMSLSSSHVSQFFKAMLHGCKSPEDDLVDVKSGRMSLGLVSDMEFLKGANEGWEWTIIPFYVEDACQKNDCFQIHFD